ncbi:hypothetical protein SEUCBS139899_006053 [Sporothrix eucalyptigena]
MDVIRPAVQAVAARTELAIGVHGLTLVSQGTGYGLLISLGVLFCVVILIAVKVQRAFLSEDSNTSEMFMVANRSVGTGLTASAVFSSWMWINETVLCAAMCYRYGLAIPYWWACGLCFQIALMAALGVLAKIRVPYAHTSLEIIRMRYGKTGHLVFMVMNLVNNVFGCASMILTGSQLIFGISGMNFAAATVLIPLGVVLYTAVGGLKATFLTDFLHTAVALILIIYFTLTILTHEAVGGLHGLYDKVQAVAADNYIASNYQGSLLTMKSQNAIIWGLILKFGNLALVVMDTAFWQKSFATEVRATVPGYNIAAVAIFGIPWGLGTVIGLTARAIHNTPIFPTYPDELTVTQINAGFVMPYTVKALIGPSGIVAFFVLLFMALTSTVSSSMIAVSSILSFDLYKTYINPHASDKRLVRVSHLAVIFHAFFITGIAIALNYGGADMTWLGYFRPVIACPGIIPLALTLGWKRQTKTAAVVAPILGFLTGLAIWLGTAYHYSGVINMTSTEGSLPALFGAIGSFFSPLIYSVVISLWWRPYVFDWREFLRIEIKEHDELVADSSEESAGETSDKSGSATPVVAADPPSESADEKAVPSTVVKPTRKTSTATVSLDDIEHPLGPEALVELHRWLRIAWIFFVFVVLVTFILWPMPLYRNYIFSKTFFTSWTTVAIIWQFIAFFAVVVFPIYDGRHAIATGTRGVYHAVSAFIARNKN